MTTTARGKDIEGMMEGLWSMDFTAEAMHGAGVVVFETNRVYGGDDKYYYVGTSSVIHGKLQAIVDVTHFAGSALSIFGPESNFSLGVIGEIRAPRLASRRSVKGSMTPAEG
jgi:hypothetical protein